jgi:thiamine phosphate synthase YjbQ (UPF0047 family)
MIKQRSINVETRGRGTIDITRDIADCVQDAGISV